MPTCATCRSEVAEKDFFCWNCGKPWRGGGVVGGVAARGSRGAEARPVAGEGVFEQQVYDEYAQKMREEYVQDRKVRSITLAVFATMALGGVAWAWLDDGRYRWFTMTALGALALFAAVRSLANWNLHRSAKARLEGERAP